MKINKIANREDKMPNGEEMALYVQTLKRYIIDNPNVDEELIELINKVPSPRKIRQDFSFQEIKILYETVEYLWKKITGGAIIPDKEIIKSPETLKGNYWLINNGILLHGINHYDIIKRNTQLICSLLDISGMALQENLCSQPNKLIHFIIKHGGIRIFITNDRRLYSQMSPKIYGRFGRDKIRKLDFKYKVAKIIDLKAKYDGWTSGITIKL